jgi:surface antigen
VCQITAQAGHTRLGPLHYVVRKPLVVLTGRVPRDARSLAWVLRVRCASSRTSAARARAATVRVRVEGRREGATVLFARGSVRVHAYSPGASVAPEAERAKGGKGGYVCASAWDGYRSVLDASSYCTGYCTWFVWQKRPEAQLKDLGNAWEWWDGAKARGIPEGAMPVVGAVAWWGISAHAPEGHVAYVIGASASSVTIEEMNRAAWDVADTRTVPLSSGEAPNGYIYGGPAGNGPGSGGGPGAGSSSGDASPLAERLAVLEENGTMVAKEGLGGEWVAETGPNVKTLAVSNNILAVLEDDGTVVAKEGGLGSAWVSETGPNVKALAVSNNRLAVLEESGVVAVKEGLGGEWVAETGPNVKTLAVSNNILAVLEDDGTVVAKEGGLGSAWVSETGPNVKALAVSNNRLAVLEESGVVAVKEGLGGEWVAETGPNVKALAVSE